MLLAISRGLETSILSCAEHRWLPERPIDSFPFLSNSFAEMHARLFRCRPQKVLLRHRGGTAAAGAHGLHHRPLQPSPVPSPISSLVQPDQSLAGRSSLVSMSSDADYASFLDQANQDTSGGGSASAASIGKKAELKTVDSAVPARLKQLDVFYVSEADEPFEPVSLKWTGGDSSKLDDKAFGKLVGHSGEVETLSTKEFDPKGQYKKVLDAVREEIGGGEVKIFRVGTSKTKAEYFIVGVHEDKVLGVKASAVES